jgi:hypothetical protein
MRFRLALLRSFRMVAVLSAAVGVSSGPGSPRSAMAEILLSELMYRPINGNANSEWIEIFNAGASAVDLSGWQVGKPSQSAWSSAFPAGTTLGPNQALVITPSASTFDSNWGGGISRLQTSNFPSLPDDPTSTTGRIAIRNGGGLIQDEVTYSTSGWPNVGAPSSSHSIYVLPQNLSTAGNNAGNNWSISTTGLYGGKFRDDNHASPGVVASTPQAPFAPSPDAVWSMVVLPDTQNYVERTHAYPLFQGQTQWIKDHKDEFNIQVVLHEGDIVNRNSGTASNGVTAVEQWQRARDAMSTLDGVVPYVMATGNHDYGTTNSQTRDTKLNTYFKANQNPLVNLATGGILKGTMVAGELQNAYYEFTAPDGRDMLVVALEFWSRNSAITWAKSVADQAQFADHTGVLLTHSHVTPGDGFWTTGTSAYEMEGGNDGQDVWNKLLSTTGNFEMTFNGHLGGDETGYRVGQNNAGEGVHQMFFNTQQQSNAGNGWMRVVEFLEDGETVRIRTYSPHHDLYRTASDHEFTFKITHVGSPLVWNTGVAAFGDGFARSDGEQGVGVVEVSPWGAGGKEALLVGFGGNASINGNQSRTIASLRVGTDQAAAEIAGRNGDGTVNVSGSINLTISASTGTGDLVIGEGGYHGAMNWDSAGTLTVQGDLSIGLSGTGTFQQTSGMVVTSNPVILGSGGVGVGTYAISGGLLRTAADGSGAFRIAHAGGTGTLRVSGAAGALHGAELYIASGANTGGVGRLEIIGDAAVVQVGQLENDAGVDETIRWEASAVGVAPLVVTGLGPAAQAVQLQDISEVAANTGTGSTLSGDGIALSLDLSLLTGSQTLTLIDNRSTQAITGFFENGTTGDLYEEGAAVLGTGFDGAVTISYVGSSGIGSAGNDVVLSLLADSSPNADFDSDGDVDGADFLVWQRNVGAANPTQSQGDADGNGVIDAADVAVWQTQFGPGTPAGAVPEPAAVVLAGLALLATATRRRGGV